MLAGVAQCRRSQKWGYGGGSRLGFKLQAGGHEGQGTMRDHVGRKGVKGLLLAGHKEVPHSFG